jgi:spore coat polysaccharide biosynthesis predicted glycosyltransferase SpsG
MAVDDAPTRGHDADIVLDQTYGRSASAYRALAPRAEVLAGTDYALLRPQFAAWRNYSLNRRSASGGRIDRILVAFGGSDPDDFASPLVEQLTQNSDCAVTAILGSCHPAAARLWAIAQASCGRIRVHEHLDDVARVMADCDLAIGAAGSMSWERCTLGLPTLLAVLAPNQVSVAQALVDNGAAWCLGRSRQEAGNRLARLTRELLENPERVSAASRAAAGICDGQGCARAAQALVAAMVRARGGEPGQT